MPITPERLNTRQEVRGAVSSHFWEQPVQSSHFLDGLAYNLPAEPLSVVPAPSGLSRTQQLLALQAWSLPLIPAFDGSAGGTVSFISSTTSCQCRLAITRHGRTYADLRVQVLDRVIARAGGLKWWTALSGRAKAQQMLKAHRDGKHVVRNRSIHQHTSQLPFVQPPDNTLLRAERYAQGDTLKDLNNYGLCSRLRLTAGRYTPCRCLTAQLHQLSFLAEHAALALFIPRISVKLSSEAKLCALQQEFEPEHARGVHQPGDSRSGGQAAPSAQPRSAHACGRLAAAAQPILGAAAAAGPPPAGHHCTQRVLC